MKKIVALLIMVVACLSLTFAACEIQPATDNGLKNAKAFLQNMYKDEKQSTSSDYTRTSVLTIDGKKFDVSWSVEIDPEADVEENYVEVVANDENTVTIAVHQTDDSLVDVSYELIAIIKAANGSTASVTFERYVPKFQVMTYAEYAKLDDDKNVIVDGIVTGIVSKSLGDSTNCLFLQDASSDTVKGGFYVYGMSEDPITDLHIELGQTVRVKGTKDTYNGTLEVVPTSVKVMDETVKTVTPIDLTSAYKAAAAEGGEGLKASSLVDGQAMLVTIKGVELTSSEVAEKYTKYNFKLDGLESYLYVSTSVCPLNEGDTTAFAKLHADNFGATADVTGVVCVYKSGSDLYFYLTPVTSSAISSVVASEEKTPAQIVAFEKAALSVTSSVIEASSVTLPQKGATYEDVVITWVSDKDCAKVEGDELVVTIPDEDTTVTLTATLTLGSGDSAVTDTATFSVAIPSAATLSVDYVKDAADLVEGEYKALAMFNTKLAKVYYCLDSMSGYYVKTTTDVAKAAKIVVAKIEGGYSLQVVLDDKSQYLNIVKSEDGKHINLIFDNSVKSTWIWSETAQTLAVKIGDVEYVPGTYGTHNTFGAVNATETTDYFGRLVKADATTSCDHAWDDGEVTTEPSCTQPGVKTYTCSKCSLTKTEPIAATGHKDENGDNVCDICNADLNGVEAADKGTKENPYTVAEALEIAGALEKGTYTEKVYIHGIIKSVGTYGSYLSSVYIVDKKDDATPLLVWSCSFTDAVKAAYPNDTVLLHGYLTNYNGTLEVSSKKIGSDYDYVTLEDRVVGSSDISVSKSSSDKATVTLSATSGENGSTFTFTVSVTFGYELVSVKVNGTVVTANDNGDYTGTIAGPTEVLVETKEVGAADPITKSVVIKDYAHDKAWSNGTKYTTLDIDENVSVKVSGTDQNTGKYYTTGNQWRMYQIGSPSITVEAIEGYTIISVKITYDIDKTGILTLNSEQVGSGTVVAVNHAKVVFGVGNTSTVTNGQVRITAIEVVYAPVEA